MAKHINDSLYQEYDDAANCMSYVSADGEEGYPGQLKTDITYRISGGTELEMEMTAVTDKPTVINLTNHSFFNLAGVETEGSILDHRLTIAADSYLPVSPGGIPLGAPQKVDATPFDFRTPHPVGARMVFAQGWRCRTGLSLGTCDQALLVYARPAEPRPPSDRGSGGEL